MVSPIIKFKEVVKYYGSSVILNKINLDIYPGDIFGVIGASGAGKSTLLSTLIGFVPVDSGDVFFRHDHLLTYKDSKDNFFPIKSKLNEIKKIFGFASQSPSFYTKLTVYENLHYFGSLYGMPNEAIKSNINTLLSLMELKTKQDTLAENLSGGMQRRLDIACALVHDPKVLILDEPTADLDPFLRKHILKLIKKINKKGTTVILSSHNLAELETICTRIGILYNNRFLVVGSPDQLKDKFSKLEEIHIETFPGNYDVLMNNLNDGTIEKIENKGTKLVLYTATPEKVLHHALHVIDSSNESLIDVKLSKPSLDEVFLSLSKGARQIAKQLAEAKKQEDQGQAQ